MAFSTQVYLPEYDPILYGQVRSISDQFGKPGIEGKKKQKNPRIRRKGYIRILWPSRRLAKRYQRLIKRRFGLRSRRFKL